MTKETTATATAAAPTIGVFKFDTPKNLLMWQGSDLHSDTAPLAFVPQIEAWLSTSSPSVGERYPLNRWYYAEVMA